MKKRYIDYDLINKYPNKHSIKPKDINRLVVKDWDKLKKKTWKNEAMASTGEWWCHIEGSDGGGLYGDDEDEFWIGFNKTTGKVKHRFSSHDGMFGYEFDSFYDISEIENKWDMNVQVNTIKYLNELIDDGIVELGK